MLQDPTERVAVTTRERCERANRAHERLYRMLDCDEPDLGNNVTFMVGRVMLMRLAAGLPERLDVSITAAVDDLVERAEQVTDPWTAEAWFHSFAEQFATLLDRRGAERRVTGHPGRRASDSLERPGPSPAVRPRD